MKFFGVKYFTKYFVKYLWSISKISRWTMDAGCIVHCNNKVSKPAKGKYLLLCMNSIMYFLPYNFIYFNHVLKVLSHFIRKIKNFMKYFKGVLKYFLKYKLFLNISKWNISSCIPHLSAWLAWISIVKRSFVNFVTLFLSLFLLLLLLCFVSSKVWSIFMTNYFCILFYHHAQWIK